MYSNKVNKYLYTYINIIFNVLFTDVPVSVLCCLALAGPFPRTNPDLGQGFGPTWAQPKNSFIKGQAASQVAN